MQRYIVNLNLTVNSLFKADEEMRHHLINVMRSSIGTQFIVVDKKQEQFLAKIVAIHKDSVEYSIIEQQESSVELPNRVAIACGLSKNDKIEWIVQKATECGMHDFFPLNLTRDVMKWQKDKADKKIGRLEKIAKEATEQSHRIVCPTIHPVSSLQNILEISKDYQIKLIAYEESAKKGEHLNLVSALKQVQPQEQILMVFGSEGGLTENEVDLMEQSGFISCSLGPRILRAETAPIYFLNALSYQLELLNGGN